MTSRLQSLEVLVHWPDRKSHWTRTPFYKRGKSIGKIPRRLEGAEVFAVLSSPSHVARLLEFLFSVDSFCCGDDAIGF